MSSIEDTLREIIEPYRYGKFDLLDRMDELSLFKENEHSVTIDNWFNYSPTVLSGDCNELTIKVLSQLDASEPRLRKRVVWGFDGSVFTPYTSAHCFLIVYDEKGNEIVVDPSLQYVGQLNQSSYAVMCDENKEFTITKLVRGRIGLELEQPGESSFIALDNSSIYYAGLNTLGGDDVLSLYKYNRMGDGDPRYKNQLHQLRVGSKRHNCAFDIVSRLNDYFASQIEVLK